jgi:hypothetical protein
MNDDDTELCTEMNNLLDGGIYVILLVGPGSSTVISYPRRTSERIR